MRTSGEIKSLTGLRGVAALVVMSYHYRNLGMFGRPYEPSSIGPGYLMVDLFFILSGFVMARTYGAAFAQGFTWPAYTGFLEARIARVYPLYLLGTVALFLLTLVLAMPYPTHPGRALLSNLLLVQNLGSGLICAECSEKLILPGWSISTEAGAYLLFPVLASFALFRSTRWAAGFAASCMASLVFVDHLPLSWLHALQRRGSLDVAEGTTLWPLLRCLAGFGMGLVAWRVSALARLSAAIPDPATDLLLLVILAGLWITPGSDLALVALFPVLVVHLCRDRSPLALLLGSQVPRRIGEWSYAIYLLHWPALLIFPAVLAATKAARLPHAWTVGLTLIGLLTIALSALSHHFVERPARRQIRALFRRRPMAMLGEPSAP